MGDLLERIYGVFFQPATTLREICKQEAVQQSLIVLAVVALLTSWTGYFTLWAKSLIVLGTLVATIMMWLISTALAHLTAELMGGNGRVKALLAANGYIRLPRMFTVPLIVLGSYLPVSLRYPLLLITGLVLGIWEFVLGVIAIRECYGFSTGKAVVVLIAPYAMLLLPLLVIAIAAAAGIFKFMALMHPDMMQMFAR